MYNILIVDDERIERNGIIMLLKRLSINAGIVEAANGKEAYEYLCSDEAGFITGSDYPIDGGFIKLNN